MSELMIGVTVALVLVSWLFVVRWERAYARHAETLRAVREAEADAALRDYELLSETLALLGGSSATELVDEASSRLPLASDLLHTARRVPPLINLKDEAARWAAILEVEVTGEPTGSVSGQRALWLRGLVRAQRRIGDGVRVSFRGGRMTLTCTPWPTINADRTQQVSLAGTRAYVDYLATARVHGIAVLESDSATVVNLAPLRVAAQLPAALVPAPPPAGA